MGKDIFDAFGITFDEAPAEPKAPAAEHPRDVFDDFGVAFDALPEAPSPAAAPVPAPTAPDVFDDFDISFEPAGPEAPDITREEDDIVSFQTLESAGRGVAGALVDMVATTPSTILEAIGAELRDRNLPEIAGDWVRFGMFWAPIANQIAAKKAEELTSWLTNIEEGEDPGKIQKAVGSMLADWGGTARKFWEKVEKDKIRPDAWWENKKVWDNPEVLMSPTWWAYNLGSLGTNIAATMVPAVGAARAVKASSWAAKLNPKVAAKLAKFGDATLKKAMTKAAERRARKVGAVVGGVTGGALEASGTYRSVIEAGGSPQEARRAAELQFVFAAGLNAISVGKWLDDPAQKLYGRLMQRLGRGTVEAITEGLEEPAEAIAMIQAKMENGEIPEDRVGIILDAMTESLDVGAPSLVLGFLAPLGSKGQAAASLERARRIFGQKQQLQTEVGKSIADKDLDVDQLQATRIDMEEANAQSEILSDLDTLLEMKIKEGVPLVQAPAPPGGIIPAVEEVSEAARAPAPTGVAAPAVEEGVARAPEAFPAVAAPAPAVEESFVDAKTGEEIKVPERQGGEIGAAQAAFENQYGASPGDIQETRVLNTEQASAMQVADFIGSKITYFEAKKGTVADNVNGFFYNNRIYLNKNVEKPALSVLGHESFHELRRTDPKAFNSLMEVIKEESANFAEYQLRLNRTRQKLGMEPLPENKVLEEFAADIVGEEFAKKEFWGKVNARDAVLGKKLARIINNLIEKIKASKWYKQLSKSDPVVKNVEGVQNAIADVYADIVKKERKRKAKREKVPTVEEKIAPVLPGIVEEPARARQLEVVIPGVKAPGRDVNQSAEFSIKKSRLNRRVWNRKLEEHGPDMYTIHEAGDPEILFKVKEKIKLPKWYADFEDSQMGKVNARLVRELDVFEQIFGPVTTAKQVPGKLVGTKRPLARGIAPYDFLSEYYRVIENGDLAQIMDRKKTIKKLAIERKIKGARSLPGMYNGTKKEVAIQRKRVKQGKLSREAWQFMDKVNMLRQGSLYLEADESGKPILSENGKAGMSTDLSLATCHPTTPCKECYASGILRQGPINKSVRNTLHILADPKDFGRRVAAEAARVPKADLPFIRLQGSGDIVTSAQVTAYNEIAKHADRPIQIFSRHHDMLRKLKSTSGAPFIKIGSIDADLVKHYGLKYLKNNEKFGIANAYLYTDSSELKDIQKLLDNESLHLILSASTKLHKSLPLQAQRSSCPCDADERSYIASCRQCALSYMGCFMSFVQKGVDKNGKVWDIADPARPKKIYPVLQFMQGVGAVPGWTAEATAYSRVAQAVIQQNIDLIWKIYLPAFRKGERKSVPLKDIRWPKDITQATEESDILAYVDNMRLILEAAKLGTFYLPGGNIQAPIAFKEGKKLADATVIDDEKAQTLAFSVKRSAEYDVGKDIGGAVYVHRSHEHLLPGIEEAKEALPEGWTYEVVKYNKKTKALSFVQAPQFDTAEEPAAGDAVLVHKDGTTKTIKAGKDPWIYHHKWLMVDDRYSGFDVQASKRRSELWTAIEGIDTSKIGKKSYWEKNVLPKIPADETLVDTKMAFKNEEVGIANDTARDLGAVGAKAVVPRVVRDVAKKGDAILDFGSGPIAQHTMSLRKAGYKKVSAHEFGNNVRADVHDPKALRRKHDVVFASNVMNVQSSPEMFDNTFNQILQATKVNGTVVVNMPASPRKGFLESMVPSEARKYLRRKLEDNFSEVRTAELDGKSRPDVFVAKKKRKIQFSVKNAAQYQQSLPTFKRWFGKSKVVDENGDPLVVYHGSRENIESFVSNAQGVHFGTSEQANMRAAGTGKRLIPVFLKVNKLRRSKDPGGDWRSQIKSAKKAGFDGIIYLNRFEGLSVENVEKASNAGINLDTISDSEFKKRFPEAQDSYIVFSPKQVKSIFNRGAYDVNADDISMSIKKEKWYSQLEKVLEQKLPGKGTGASYLQTINAWAKKGMFKAEEWEWSGLRDILEFAPKTKYDKSEIMEILAENNIRVEETVLGTPIESESFREEFGEYFWIQADHVIAERFEVGSDRYERASDALEEAVDDYITYGDQEAIENVADELDMDLEQLMEGVAEQRAEAGTIARHGKYVVAGGENYRELLIQLPSLWEKRRYDFLRKMLKKYGDEWETEANIEEVALAVHLDTMSTHEREYIGPDAHYGKVPNILASVRFNERVDSEGRKVLFIEEIQSDWHQEGFKRGYQSLAEKRSALERFDRLVKAQKNLWIDEIVTDTVYLEEEDKGRRLTEKEKKIIRRTAELAAEDKREVDIATELDQLQIFYSSLNATKSEAGAPDGPFKKSWPMLAMKRMVRWAAENDFDAVAWTPGDVQKERYNLRKHLSEIRYRKNRNDGRWKLRLYDLNGDRITRINTSLNISSLADSELESLMGKGLADRLRAGEGKALEDDYKSLTGEDLVVGGAAMNSFYDRQLVNETNKIFNKPAWGKSKIQTTTITIGSEIEEGRAVGPKQTEVWMLPVTNEMREKALIDGMPQFSVKDISVNKHSTFLRNRLESVATPEALEALSLNERGVPFWNEFLDRRSGKGVPIKILKKEYEELYGKLKKFQVGPHQVMIGTGKIMVPKFSTKEVTRVRKIERPFAASYNLYSGRRRVGHIGGGEEYTSADIGAVGKELGFTGEYFELLQTLIDEEFRGTGQYQQLILMIATKYPNGIVVPKFQASTALQKALRKIKGYIETENYIHIRSREIDASEVRLPEISFSAKKGQDQIANDYVEMLESSTPNERVQDPDKTVNPLEKAPEAVRVGVERSRGIPQSPFIKRMKLAATKTRDFFMRHRPYLDPKTEGDILNVLRIHQEVPENARRRAMEVLDNILQGMDRNQYNTFTMAIIMDDMMRDLETGVLSGEEGLPFGFESRKEAKAYRDYIYRVVKADPKVRDALARRQRVNRKLKEVLVKYDLLPEDVLEDDRYFHHQVLEYREANSLGEQFGLSTGTAAQRVQKRKMGWQKARTGSIKDYNTEYAEAEFEVLAQAFTQLETMETLNRLHAMADMTETLKEVAKQQGVKDWETLIPNGFTQWSPAPGSAWYKANSITDRLLHQVQSDAAILTSENIDESVRAVWARGRDPRWVISDGLAKTLNEFGNSGEDHAFSRASRWAISMWKKWILINPFRIVKYNLNNWSGDLDIALAYDFRILKHYNDAMKQLYRDWRKKELPSDIQKELEQARRLGVIGSGWSVQEVTDVTSELSFNNFMAMMDGSRPDLVQKVAHAGKRYWKFSKDVTAWRENILRLAAFRYFKERVAAGEKVYGASNKTEVDQIKRDPEKAAKLARDLIGDYGNISHAGQWIRAHMIPFYAWLEVNAPRYVRLMRNLKHEEKSAKLLSAAVAWRGTKLGIKASMLMFAVMLFNRLAFPDEEDELTESQRRQQHIILGRRADGSVRTLRFQGAFSDALAWFGLENPWHDIENVVKGKVTAKEQLIESGKAPFIKLASGTRPDVKVGFEAAFGYSLYPDPFAPRPIRDRIEHIARMFSMDSLYRVATGKPRRGDTAAKRLLNDVTRLAVYSSDPGEGAYYQTKAWMYTWMDRMDIERPSARPTSKSNAMYYYRQALKFGDLPAAERYLEQFYKLGGTYKGLQQSIKRAHPLAGMKAADRNQFLKSLNERQREVIDIATAWYYRTYVRGQRAVPTAEVSKRVREQKQKTLRELRGR